MSTFSGRLTGEGTPLKYRTGTQADVEIEHLPQRDVERANAAADGRGERALDPDAEGLEGLDGVVRQPAVEFLEALFTGENFHPGDLLLSAVCLFDRRVENALAGPPDVRAGAVAFDKWNDGPVGHAQRSAGNCNRLSARGRGHIFELSHDSRLEQAAANVKMVRHGSIPYNALKYR